MTRDPAVELYSAIKVGVKKLEDSILELGSLKKVEKSYSNKIEILKALGDNDIEKLRDISNYFYRTNGVYFRACNYFSTMYRYDWYITPEVYDQKINTKEVVKEFYRVLNYLDNSNIKKTCNDIALQVILNGAYYCVLVETDNGLFLQELPVGYTRSRYSYGGIPTVELNMKFFDDKFRDIQYRMRVLKMFPKDIQKGYALYKSGKLKPDHSGDNQGAWYLLEPGSAFKFSLDNGERPLFVNAIPAILDLDAAQDLDRRKQMQQLLKILVQKLPFDKNGDLIFDIDEARDIHNNAVEMLRRAIGLDVLTTFTDVQAINISDSNTTTKSDDLERVERSVFNSFGISQNLFNTDGNLSLEKSILNDEGSFRPFVLQLSSFYDMIAQKLSKKKKKYSFRLYMLETTQYNYKELSKLYKEQVQIGYSKMLPQIALGHSQSFILNSARFENEVLKLHEIMIPPLMSSTMSSEDVLGRLDKSKVTGKQNTGESEKTGGRPALADDQKSEKTIKNMESSN